MSLTSPSRSAPPLSAGVSVDEADDLPQRSRRAAAGSAPEPSADPARRAAAFMAAPVALFVVDAAGLVQAANAAADRQLPRPAAGPDELAARLGGRGGRGAKPRVGICPVLGAVRRAFDGRAEPELLVELGASLEGGGRWGLVRVERMDVVSGGGVLVAVQEVTGLLRAERGREALQALVTQADRLASIGLLAAGMAHELNNPLAVVLQSLGSVLDDLPRIAGSLQRCLAGLEARVDPDVGAALVGQEGPAALAASLDDLTERLCEAMTGAMRVQQVAQGLGTFARADSVELGPVDVDAVVDRALCIASQEIHSRARLVRDTATARPVLATDGKLVQIVLGLLLNAVQAIPAGESEANEIRVRAFTEGSRVHLEVSDTGRGIPAELQSRVFEPFFTTKEVGAGSGLGLAICRNLVNEMGGRISFSSVEGRGATFTVELPVAESSAPLVAGPAGSAAPGRRPSPRGRVLVIDDEEGLRLALRRLLGADHEVVLLGSGEEALARLEQDREFDVIVCDLMMPKVSGVEVHAWLQQRDPALAARLVFLTGGAFTPPVRAYLGQVDNLRVDKPFEPQQLRALVAARVRDWRGRRAE